MDNTKKTQYTIITIVVLLLLVVIALTLLLIINASQTNSTKVKINQIYLSDYNLQPMGDYFIGSYNNNTINVIINKQGEEVYKSLEDIPYSHIYMLKDDNYLIYNQDENSLNAYIFDGEAIKKLYQLNDVKNIKPLIYKNSYQEYIVGFVMVKDTDTYLYNINDGHAVIIRNALLIGDDVDEDKYYVHSNKYLIMKNTDNLMGAVDYNGYVVIPYQYPNMINTYNDSFIIENQKQQYGIISNKNEEIIKPNYKVIALYENYYLIVNKNNKLAIYSKDYNQIIDFKMKYDSLLDYDLRSSMNSLHLYRAGGRLFVVNNYMEDVNKTEYENHNLYVISNGKINETIKQIGFGVNNIIYLYDKDYNLKIYDTDFNLLFSVQLNDVKKINNVSLVSNNIIKINYTLSNEQEVNKYYNQTGEEVDFTLGKLVLRNEEYVAYIKESDGTKSLNILDNNDNLLDSINGQNIIVKGNFAIVDKGIYEIVKKEK